MKRLHVLIGLWQRPLLPYYQSRREQRLATVWEETWGEDTWEWRLIFLAVADLVMADLVMNLDVSTIVMTSLFGIMTTVSFTVSSSLLISLGLASLRCTTGRQ